jgi:hypothetical protein
VARHRSFRAERSGDAEDRVFGADIEGESELRVTAKTELRFGFEQYGQGMATIGSYRKEAVIAEPLAAGCTRHKQTPRWSSVTLRRLRMVDPISFDADCSFGRRAVREAVATE